MAMSRTLIAQRYRLVRPLGRGGMGTVWLAHDEALDRDVAVKEIVIPAALTEAEGDQARRRSLREARTAARLNHLNVIRMYDIVESDSRQWIVMEYVPSRSLHDVISQDGPLPPERVARIGLGVLAALQAAHRAGVLHRDVKPSNVLLTADGRVVLSDFGLAVVAGSDTTVTRPGMILGSPAYISPERAREGISGPASDLWSLGATVYADRHADRARDRGARPGNAGGAAAAGAQRVAAQGPRGPHQRRRGASHAAQGGQPGAQSAPAAVPAHPPAHPHRPCPAHRAKPGTGAGQRTDRAGSTGPAASVAGAGSAARTGSAARAGAGRRGARAAPAGTASRRRPGGGARRPPPGRPGDPSPRRGAFGGTAADERGVDAGREPDGAAVDSGPVASRHSGARQPPSPGYPPARPARWLAVLPRPDRVHGRGASRRLADVARGHDRVLPRSGLGAGPRHRPVAQPQVGPGRRLDLAGGHPAAARRLDRLPARQDRRGGLLPRSRRLGVHLCRPERPYPRHQPRVRRLRAPGTCDLLVDTGVGVAGQPTQLPAHHPDVPADPALTRHADAVRCSTAPWCGTRRRWLTAPDGDRRAVVCHDNRARQRLRHRQPGPAPRIPERRAGAGLDPDAPAAVVRIELAIDGSDMWVPELVFVWGERPARDPRGPFLPLAMEMRPGALSTDRDEGRPARPISPVQPGTSDTIIRDVLLITETADAPDAGTDSTVTLEVDLLDSQPSEAELPDSPQADLERATANLYQGVLATAFTRDRLQGLRLRNTGDDAWGRPSVALPLLPPPGGIPVG